MPDPVRLVVQILLAALTAAAPACSGNSDTTQVVEVPGGIDRPTREELERGRHDVSWREVVQLDTTLRGDTVQNPERWEQITAAAVNGAATFLPLGEDDEGASVLRVQVLLDRVAFSPGVIDGKWGVNTEKAVYWFQRREGLRATARVDSATFARLSDVAGKPAQIVRGYQLGEADVAGPFIKLPDDIYEVAQLPCTCYESLSEKLSETFHVTPELLALLNPGVDLNSLQAGSSIQAPSIRDEQAPAPAPVAEILISDRGRFVHALDANGRILYHFPSTLGSTYDPSPTGRYSVTRIAHDPEWHFQPTLLSDVPNSRPDALIPPGPNNAVGVVWMALSAPHYGIHGTSAPETIGYTSSHGCVRLTNWDARFLASRIEPGTPVVFRDVHGVAVTSRN